LLLPGAYEPPEGLGRRRSVQLTYTVWLHPNIKCAAARIQKLPNMEVLGRRPGAARQLWRHKSQASLSVANASLASEGPGYKGYG